MSELEDQIKYLTKNLDALVTKQNELSEMYKTQINEKNKVIDEKDATIESLSLDLISLTRAAAEKGIIREAPETEGFSNVV